MSARLVENSEILAALQGAKSVSAAARAAGCSRALVHQRAKEDEAIGAELERLKSGRGKSRWSQRRHAKAGHPERDPSEEGAPLAAAAEADDPGSAEKAKEDRELALEALREVTATGPASAKVMAAKALLAHAETRARPAAAAKPEAGPEEAAGGGATTINLEKARAQILGL